jgi:hypothetical protein
MQFVLIVMLNMDPGTLDISNQKVNLVQTNIEPTPAYQSDLIQEEIEK